MTPQTPQGAALSDARLLELMQAADPETKRIPPGLRAIADALVNEGRRLTAEQGGADRPSKAIEFAEYMAKRAEQLLEALNVEDEAHMTLNDFDSDDAEFEAADAAHVRAIEARCDLATGLRSGIYEFRKRAATQPQAEPAYTRLREFAEWCTSERFDSRDLSPRARYALTAPTEPT